MFKPRKVGLIRAGGGKLGQGVGALKRWGWNPLTKYEDLSEAVAERRSVRKVFLGVLWPATLLKKRL